MMQTTEKVMPIPVRVDFHEALKLVARQRHLTLSAFVRLTLQRELEAIKRGATGDDLPVQRNQDRN